MKNFPVFRRDFFVAPQDRYESIAVPTFQCDSWTESQVVEWLKGSLSQLRFYPGFRRRRWHFDLSSSHPKKFHQWEKSIPSRSNVAQIHRHLQRTCSKKCFVRDQPARPLCNQTFDLTMIFLQCHVVPEENLQRLSMLVDVATNNLKRSVYNASYALDESNVSNCDSLRLSETLIAVINNVYEVNSLVRRLLFWLDRYVDFPYEIYANLGPHSKAFLTTCQFGKKSTNTCSEFSRQSIKRIAGFCQSPRFWFRSVEAISPI